MSVGTQGASKVWIHMVLSGLDFKAPWSMLGAHVADSPAGCPVTAYAEDCRWAYGKGSRLVYLPRRTTIRRSVVAFSWNADAHNQGYYTSEFGNSTTFDEVIFCRNGFKTDPRVDPDPRRNIFSRNIYQGGGGFGIGLTAKPETYEDGKTYSQRNNTIRGNIAYRTGAGIQITGDWSGVKGNVVEGNVVVAKNAVRNSAAAVDVPKGLALRKNRFCCNAGLPAESGADPGNSIAAYASAAATERWPDPNRTLKRYVTEVLRLTLLDWKDDPLLDPAARDARAAAGESYDPTGLKTFMAVATNMRRGGVTPVPASGKPSWTGDYAWDERLTGRAVVNWIREGFGLPRH